VSRSDHRLPLSVVTGFLGSGKTTLLKRILGTPEMRNSCVLVNEVADIGVDHRLLQPLSNSVLLLENGCVCCTMRDDLRAALLGLVESGSNIAGIDRIIVETTGLANPAPMIETVVAHPILNDRIRINGVLTLVDCVNADSGLDEYPEFISQIIAADCVVMTKTDLVEDRAIERIADIVRDLNPIAGMVIHDDKRIIDFLQNGKHGDVVLDWQANNYICGAGARLDASPRHTDVKTFCISLGRACDWTAFATWLSLLIHAYGKRVLRVKGILNVDDGSAPVAISCVQNLVYFPEHLDDWPDSDHRSILVFIVRNLDQTLILHSLRAFIGSDSWLLLSPGGDKLHREPNPAPHTAA
jgi:G3E family GTPase